MPATPHTRRELDARLRPRLARRLSPEDVDDLVTAAAAALAGGKEVLEIYRRVGGRKPGGGDAATGSDAAPASDAVDVEEKAPRDPVTEADRAANRAVLAALRDARPGEAVWSEESPAPEPESRRGRLWVVDPLDGTKEFLSRNGEFAVMVGLAVAGRARLGAVYRPDPGVLHVGASAGGAWELRLEEGGGEPRALDVAEADAGGTAEAARGSGGRTPGPGAVPGTDPEPPRPVRLLHSRSHRPPGLTALREAFDEVRAVPCGSVGVKCARIAAGEADLYVHPVPYLKEWDTCAPEAVLRGAGGRVTDCRGEPLAYGKEDAAQPGGIFAGRPGIWRRAAPTVRVLAP